VFVKFRHDVFATVYGGRGAILIELHDAMTTEPGHIVFVDNFGMSRVVLVVVVVVVGGCEERLEVCHEDERKGFLFFNVGEFQLAIVGIGILDLLRRVLDTERNVSFERERSGRRTGDDSCYIREWNNHIWTCVPLNWTCWLCARSGVSRGRIRLGAAEDLYGALCLFEG